MFFFLYPCCSFTVRCKKKNGKKKEQTVQALLNWHRWFFMDTSWGEVSRQVCSCRVKHVVIVQQCIFFAATFFVSLSVCNVSLCVSMRHTFVSRVKWVVVDSIFRYITYSTWNDSIASVVKDCSLNKYMAKPQSMKCTY